MTPRLYTICIRSARPADLAEVELLLSSNSLPVVGVREAFDDFFVAEGDRPNVHPLQIVGAIGLERFGSKALLRSAVVADEWRGWGFGRQLVDELVEHARSVGVDELYLLTTTAEQFFARLGFRRIDRADVPASVRGSVEFTRACPDTAVAMARSFAQKPTR
ncbi:MAG TPA: arsenic resistance N-acetyltransferase ArsN2 [Gemmatimonadaceae bacterium]|nr:arsenic resistance N-acetyltransferase ArsN2 [Gemmatimonadaceae bacterium]